MHRLDLPYTADVEILFLRLSTLSGCVWLDSGKPGSTLGRYDILSALPSEQISGDVAAIQERLNSRLIIDNIDCDLPFCGGWLGYFSYAYRHQAFKLKSQKSDSIPIAQFGWYDWAIVVDHQESKATLVFQSSCADDIRERVHAITGIAPVVELVPPRTLPRTSSGKLSRTKARSLYLSGEIIPYDIAA